MNFGRGSNYFFPLESCTFLGNVTVNEDVSVDSATINGRSFTELVDNTLRASTGGTVDGTVIFNGSLTVDTLTTDSIMGVDRVTYMSDTIFTNSFGNELGGTLTVQDTVYVNGDTSVQGYVNGVRFPEDYPLISDPHLNFGTQRFENITFGTLNFADSATVNGISLNEIVTLHTSQTITGLKVFKK